MPPPLPRPTPPASPDRRQLSDVDVIGDVHGCPSELDTLLAALGYEHDGRRWSHPRNRVAAFIGDLTDRGCDSISALERAYELLRDGCGQMAALGNHDWRLYEFLTLGREIRLVGGVDQTLAEIAALEATPQAELWQKLCALVENAPAHSVYDRGRLVVTHGGLRPEMCGTLGSPERDDEMSFMCLNGEFTGEHDTRGRRIRTHRWVADWDLNAVLCFGHSVCGDLPRCYEGGRVINIDTGCVYGGSLSALRWPEREFVSVLSEARHSSDTALVDDELLGEIPAKELRVITPADARTLA